MPKKRKKKHKRIAFEGHILAYARDEREKILRRVVLDLFHTFNFNLLNLSDINGYTPDLIFDNKDCILIIELKSYHKSVLCAESEAVQIMKYAAAMRANKKKLQLS